MATRDAAPAGTGRMEVAPPPAGREVRWAHGPDVLWREVVGGVLVLAPGRTPAVLLSESGAAVWRIMEKPIGAEEIVREIASRYSVPSEVVAGDLAALLDDLEGRNLIQQVL